MSKTIIWQRFLKLETIKCQLLFVLFFYIQTNDERIPENVSKDTDVFIIEFLTAGIKDGRTVLNTRRRFMTGPWKYKRKKKRSEHRQRVTDKQAHNRHIRYILTTVCSLAFISIFFTASASRVPYQYTLLAEHHLLAGRIYRDADKGDKIKADVEMEPGHEEELVYLQIYWTENAVPVKVSIDEPQLRAANINSS